MYYSQYTSPVGQLLLVSDGDALQKIVFPHEGEPSKPNEKWTYDLALFDSLNKQLDAYFDGSLQKFDVSLTPTGTEFQCRVWDALSNVEYGETCSYQDIARAIGKPSASRAVGSANGANPLPIVIPCHRVIGTDGALTGFTGGLYTKQWLLSHEIGEPSLFPFEEWLSPK